MIYVNIFSVNEPYFPNLMDKHRHMTHFYVYRRYRLCDLFLVVAYSLVQFVFQMNVFLLYTFVSMYK